MFDPPAAADPGLYAGGAFTTAGGISANGIARWDGASWSALETGTGTVYALSVFDPPGSESGPSIYVGGFFTTAGGQTANYIARWDGAAWSAIGSGMSYTVYSLGVFDPPGVDAGPALYAGGGFATAGNLAANYLARWDGSDWSPLGQGLSGNARSFTTFDDGTGSAVYVGGAFTIAAGVSANRIAKWDGTSWSPLAGGLYGSVESLEVFDGGNGPELYAGGFFNVNGYIAKWNGAAWS